MSTLVSRLALAPNTSGANQQWLLLLIWLAAAVIAALLGLLMQGTPPADGTYVPLGNDSFYHARRILDSAVESRGFYQFDERVHAPEGSWIPWPWAYDFLMAKATQVAVWLAPGLDPMAFIAHVPTFWVFVNAALFLAAAGAAGLSIEMRVLAMLCFAISPLTQLLHSVGMVDHHFIEHSFVLLTIWLGLRWFGAPDEPVRAASLAVTLGLASAFHNGLFILQLLPLGTVLLCWLKQTAPPPRALYIFGGTLFVTTLLVLLPSGPFRAGMFEFGLLSWFHLYVAGCSAATLAFFAWHPFSRGSLLGFVTLCAGLALPLANQVLSGAGFLSGTFSLLDQVIEVKSPYEFARSFGLTHAAGYYSWLLLATPFLLGYFAYRALRDTQPTQIFFATAVVLGLALMLSQFRMHYFGLFVFVASGLLLVDRARDSRGWRRSGVFATAFGVIALAYQPALRERLFVIYAPGADAEYASSLAIYAELENACAADPGVVLANSDDGNPILFHSECSVIANNFILRPEDERHLAEVDRLMRLSPDSLRVERPDIKYLFLRASWFSVAEGDTQRLVGTNPIAQQLLIDATPPPGFQVLRSVYRGIDDSGPRDLYARLYKITPAATTSDTRGGPVSDVDGR
jgi:hypothetical protein